MTPSHARPFGPLSADARSRCPPEELKYNRWVCADFKAALAPQFGLDVGFDIYRSMLGLPDWGRLQKKRLRGLRDFAAQHAVAFTDVYPAGEPFESPPPRIIGPGDRRTIKGTSRSFFVACLADARIANESLLIDVGGTMLLDYQGSELAEAEDSLVLDPDVFHASGDTVWMMPDMQGCVDVDEAFGSLIGRLSFHFGHWFWEYLPKYLTALASGALPPGTPVLRRQIHMPQPLTDALDLLLPKGTEVIELSPAPARVKRLWCAPSLMYSPYIDWQMADLTQANDNQSFPPERLRPTIDALRSVSRTIGGGTGPERVHLVRGSDLPRHPRNNAALEALLSNRGFTNASPEELSFVEQIRLVRDAKVIVGPQGSQLFLSYFARPGAKICILNHPYTYAPLTYYVPLFRTAGHDVTIFTCPVAGADDLTKEIGLLNGFDFTVDLSAFSIFLDDWLRP